MALTKNTCAKSIVRWLCIVSSPIWEAVIMFVIYLGARWFSYLRSTAIFLQVYVVATLAREAIVNFGSVFVRLIWWCQLVKYGRLVVPWNLFLASELTGFFICAVLIPLFPLYFALLFVCVCYCVFANHSVVRGSTTRRSPRSVIPRIGTTFYRLILAPLVGRDEHGKVPLLIRVVSTISNTEDRSPQSPDASVENGIGSRSSSCDHISASGKRLFTTKRFARLPLLALFMFTKLVMLYIISKKFTRLYNIIHMIAGLSMMAICAAIACVLFVALTGSHSAIVLAIALEVVMAVRGIELETRRQEVELWLSFVVPLLIQVNAHFFEAVIDSAFATMRQELGQDHRLSRASRMYRAIPTNGNEAAVKLFDSWTPGLGDRAARRNIKACVFTFDGNEFRIATGSELGVTMNRKSEI